LHHSQPTKSQPAAKTPAAKMTQRQTGKPPFSQTRKTNQEGIKKTTTAQPIQQYIQKEITFYTKATPKNPATTHNTEIRNTEMNQQEILNTTIQ